jgi:hypothetical protein
MKTLAVIITSVSSVLFLTLYSVAPDSFRQKSGEPEKGCVFNSMMGIENTEDYAKHKSLEKVVKSIDEALAWMSMAQHKDGGWGAGSHSRQGVMDPHAVEADPATTSMVGMALLRNGSTLSKGEYSNQLRKAAEFILTKVEKSGKNSLNITELTGTQIQSKLGQNIDVVLASQFLTNLKEKLSANHELSQRINKALDVCVSKIQNGQMADGSTQGAGWAGVLQSSLASNALEAAEYAGADVDVKKLDQARQYQKDNFDEKTGNVNTDKGAGIVLYSVSGSARSSAKEARKVKEELAKNGKLKDLEENEQITVDDLRDIGYSEDEAIKSATAYNVYESAKQTAQRADVMAGFGNNGGEEFLSFLQTGEGLVIAKDDSWRKWYNDIAGKMVRIQNQDGSWNGHHCITSPVFCTATCLLILSIENDLQSLQTMGGS